MMSDNLTQHVGQIDLKIEHKLGAQRTKENICKAREREKKHMTHSENIIIIFVFILRPPLFYGRIYSHINIYLFFRCFHISIDLKNSLDKLQQFK